MKKKEYINPKQAIELYREMGYGEISIFAVVDWTKRYSLGVKPGGRWKIDKLAFKTFLQKGTYNRKIF
ncbi:MAG TPA: hypothetical protein ENI08_02845 [Candidatus Dependentiae bacterium]|nr:hypothetical protein [Candidatus Dependentiae bacterium]